MSNYKFDDELPKGLRSKLDGYLRLGESVELIAESDMLTVGRYGTCYLVATDERLLVLDGNNPEEPLQIEVPLDQITDINVRTFIGNGVLGVGIGGHTVGIVRFSGTQAPKFKEVQKALGKLIEHRQGQQLKLAKPVQELPAEGERGGRRRFCPKCGRPLPRGSTVCPACLQRGKTLKRVFGYIRPYWKLVGVGLLLTLLVRGLSLIPTRLTKNLVDDVLPNPNSPLLGWIVLVILGSYGLAALFRCFSAYVNGYVGQRVIYDMRTQVFNHLQTLSLSYYDKQQTGRVITRVVNDTGRLQDFAVNTVRQLVGDILEVTLIAFILLSQNWRLTLLSLAPVPLVAIGTAVFGRMIRKIYRKLWRRMSAINAVLADAIGGVRVVKAFAQEGREKKRFGQRAESFFKENVHTIALRSKFFPAMNFVASLGVVLVWWYGGLGVINPSLANPGAGPGMLVMFIGFLWRFYAPIQRFSQLNRLIQHATTSAERVFEVLDAEPDIVDVADAVDPERLRGKVEFRDVGFSYDSGKQILEHINLVVSPGQMIGVVGRSGVGKTTLVNLIPRFYEISEGAVLVDDVDVRRLKLNKLRGSIGMVLQEPFLFHGSVYDNITYSKADATPEEVIAAARAANAHDFIMGFARGYDTEVGERGVRLSSGQKQRISIARAILNNPAVLILDEATASVDTETEREIQQAIVTLVKSRTTFAIAHRLSTLQVADRIVVLDKGKIVEQGTHNELLEKKGLYHHLCQMQAEISKVRAV